MSDENENFVYIDKRHFPMLLIKIAAYGFVVATILMVSLWVFTTLPAHSGHCSNIHKELCNHGD